MKCFDVMMRKCFFLGGAACKCGLLAIVLLVSDMNNAFSKVYWHDHEIWMSGSILRFCLPDNESSRVPFFAVRNAVDIYDNSEYTGRHIELVTKKWDFAGPLSFFRGVDGSLSLKAYVVEKPDDYRSRIDDLSNLEKLIDGYLKRAAEERRRAIEGRDGYFSYFNAPDEFRKVRINERQWISYMVMGSTDVAAYVTPLTSSHYVRFNFSYVANMKGKNAKWRAEAERVVDQIVSTLRIGDGARSDVGDLDCE